MIKVFPERLCGDKPLVLPCNLSLDQLQKALDEICEEQALPVLVQRDEVKVGKGVGSLFVQAEPCLVIYHRQHMSDYYSNVLILTQEGKRSYLSQYLGGDSKNYRNQVIGKSQGGLIGGMVARSATAKIAAEHAYYDMVNDAILEALDRLGITFVNRTQQQIY